MKRERERERERDNAKINLERLVALFILFFIVVINLKSHYPQNLTIYEPDKSERPHNKE